MRYRNFLLCISLLRLGQSFFTAETFAKTAGVEIFSDYVNWEKLAKARTSINYNRYTIVDRGLASGTLRIAGSGTSTSNAIFFDFVTTVDLNPMRHDGNGDGVFDILDPASFYNRTFTGTEQGTYAGHGSVVFTVRYEAERSVNQRTLNVGGTGTVTSSSVPNLNVGHQFSTTPLSLEPFGASGTLDFDTSSKSYSADLSRFGESGKAGKTSTFVTNDADSLLLLGFPIPNPGGATTYADVTLTRKGNLYHKQFKVGDVSYYVRVIDPNDSDADGIPDLSDVTPQPNSAPDPTETEKGEEPAPGETVDNTGSEPNQNEQEKTTHASRAAIGQSVGLGHHWYRSSWLGDYWDGNASWIYHLQLGWLYSHKDESSSSHWLYSPGLGWLWTKESIGRYLYSYSRREWFALRGASGSPALYDFRLSAWKSREGDAWIGEVSEQLFLSGLFAADVPRGDSSRQVVVEAGTRLQGNPGPVLTGKTVIFENDVTVTGTLTIR
jgi:hypothetical protein